MRCFTQQAGVASVSVLFIASLAVTGCGSSGSSGAVSCSGPHAPPGTAGSAPGASANPAVAAGWTLPGGNLANTRDVPSPITSSNVSTLGVAWCVPVQSTGTRGAAGLSDGYATTPVVVNGVVYLQDLESNVTAIRLATGKVLWTRDYNSTNGGPDGVNVVGGTVYAATNHAAVALAAATGRQLWSRTLTGNNREGIEWDDKLPSSPYGAATVTNNVVFTTTFSGDLYAFSAAAGAILLKRPMSAGTNAPVAVDGDYVIAGAANALSKGQRSLVIAYRLGADGKLPDTAGP